MQVHAILLLPYYCDLQKKFVEYKFLWQINSTCEQCHKRFSRIDHLKIHLHRHSGDKPYECEISDSSAGKNIFAHSKGNKKFNECGSLKRHACAKVHTFLNKVLKECVELEAKSGTCKLMQCLSCEKPYQCEQSKSLC